MFGFGRQLATSTSVGSPLGLTPKLTEIPAWRNKSKGTDGNQTRIADRKFHHESVFLEEKEKDISINKAHIVSKKQVSNNSNFTQLYFGEKEEFAIAILLKEDENYNIIDLDRDISFENDGIHQLTSIEDDSVDYIITSNLNGLGCNVNDIFRESYRILKEGGEICFTGQFSNMRVKNIYDANQFILKPQYLEDIRRSLNNNGFVYYQTLKEDEICYHRTSELSEDLTLFHKTLNSFKISTMEDCSEDYGQVAIYKGTASGQPNCFFLSLKNSFPVNQPIRVSGNTAEILLKSRYRKHFDVTEKLSHRGPFK